jgi:transposase
MLWPFLLENSARLMTVDLPTYSPHLNKIEKLWWYMRQKITRNHFYESFEALCQALIGWLERLPFARFCRLMGLKPRGQPHAA